MGRFKLLSNFLALDLLLEASMIAFFVMKLSL